MATNGSLLQGEVINDPESEEKDVERLLFGLLESLLKEQMPEGAGEGASS